MDNQSTEPSQANVREPGPESSITEVFIETDRSGVLKGGQLEWHAFSGQATDQSAGLGWTNAIHSEDRQAALANLQAALSSRTPYRNECRVRRADGAWRWMRLCMTPVLADDEVALRWMGVLVDFTEQALARDALRESEQRMRLAIEATGVGIWEWNIFTNLIRWDPQMFRLYGLSPTADGIVPYNIWREAVLPDEVALQEELLQRLMTEGGTGYREFQIRRADDGRLRCLRAVETIRKNDSGQVEWVVGTNLDVTETKRGEEILREQQALLREIINAIPEPIYLKDLEGRLLLVNHALCKTIGKTPEECLGKTDPEFLDDQASARLIRTTDQRILKTCIAETVEEAVTTSNGVRYYLSSKAPFCDASGKVIGLLGNSHDITERKRQEDHLEFLLREVNHRSKNLLTLIQSMARQTSARHADDFVAQFERRIQALAQSQDVLVKNGWRAVPLSELVRAQLAHFGDQLDTRISIIGPPVAITASSSQALAMALHELATNASKYGALSNEAGRLEINWCLRSARDDVRNFTMTWTEKGGPVVEPPSRLGFGSTVIDRMLRYALGFDVEVDFRPTGLVWRIDGPSDHILDGPCEHPVSPIAQAKGEVATSAMARRRVLVVDDEALIAIEMAAVLSEAGFDVIGPARSVADALDLIERLGCDAAVLDTNLGNETSEPIAARLRSRQTPLISVSGYSREQQPVSLRNVPLVTKPLKNGQLVSEVRRCFELE